MNHRFSANTKFTHMYVHVRFFRKSFLRAASKRNCFFIVSFFRWNFLRIAFRKAFGMFGFLLPKRMFFFYHASGLTHFLPVFHFIPPRKCQRFSVVFRGYKMETLARNGIRGFLLFSGV